MKTLLSEHYWKLWIAAVALALLQAFGLRVGCRGYQVYVNSLAPLEFGYDTPIPKSPWGAVRIYVGLEGFRFSDSV